MGNLVTWRDVQIILNGRRIFDRFLEMEKIIKVQGLIILR